MDAQIYIGVDGGGTGCRVAVGTKGAVLAQGKAGPANVSSDMDGAIANVKAALSQALGKADMDSASSAFAHVGLAGVLTDAQGVTVSNAMPFAKTVVTDDRPTTLTGALGGGDGVVAAIGTGSFIGSKRGGVYTFVGGWGLTLSDEASAAWLGRSALAQTLLAQDGMQGASALTDQLFAHFNGDPNAIVAFAAHATPADFGTFARYVTEAAKAGDAIATQLMQTGASYIERAFTVLNVPTSDTACLTGGLGPSYAEFFSVSMAPARGTALDGALTLARAMD